MNRTDFDLIYLCQCAVNDIAPDEDRVSKMNTEELYRLSRRHMVTALAACGLEKAGMLTEDFSKAREKAVRKNLFLDLERKKLFSNFEKTGIWYMPLKGSVLKDMYSAAGMRQMSDNDILYDSGFQNTVKEYFASQGYEVASFSKGNHDVYKKQPVLNFEMHNTLFSQSSGEDIYNYYLNVKDRLLKDDDNEYGYHFSDDDFYIYIVCHEYKHFSGAGTGIRSLLDTYVFLREKSDFLNWDYITGECRNLGVYDFEKNNRELALKVFGESGFDGDELSDEESQHLEMYVDFGIYGSRENLVRSGMKKFADKTGSTSGVRYMLSRIFPDMNFYKANYPLAYKYKILIPFCAVFRIFRAALFRRKRVLKEFSIVRSAEKEKN